VVYVWLYLLRSSARLCHSVGNCFVQHDVPNVQSGPKVYTPKMTSGHSDGGTVQVSFGPHCTLKLKRAVVDRLACC